MNYVPDLWHDFAVTVGGLAGALTGLLFVALSIKGEVLAASDQPRYRPGPAHQGPPERGAGKRSFGKA